MTALSARTGRARRCNWIQWKTAIKSVKMLVGSQTPNANDDLTGFWAVTPCLDWGWFGAGVEHITQAESMWSVPPGQGDWFRGEHGT